MGLFKKSSSTFLGIDIGAGGIKAVELNIEKKRPVLYTYGYTSEPVAMKNRWNGIEIKEKLQTPGITTEKKAPPKPEDGVAEKLADTLRAVVSSARIVSRQAVVSLPVSAVFHAVVSLPHVDKKEFETVLKAEVAKLLPYALEETALDYQLLEGPSGGHVDRVLVNAVPKSLVSFYTDVFARAGIKLLALETEAAALARSLVGRDSAITMLVDIGAERTNLFIVDNAIPVTYQSIEVGGNKINAVLARVLGIPDKLVEPVKHDLFTSAYANIDRATFMDFLLPLIDPIAKELSYGFEMYLRQSGNENKQPEKIILTGGAAYMPYLTDFLSEQFKLKCYIGDPWGRVIYQEALKPLIHSIGPRLAVAIGLALRGVV